MEKLIFNKNGQWALINEEDQLEKGIGKGLAAAGLSAAAAFSGISRGSDSTIKPLPDFAEIKTIEHHQPPEVKQFTESKKGGGIEHPNPVALSQEDWNKLKPLKTGEILTSFNDPRHFLIEKQLEDRYGLERGCLAAIRMAEGSNWHDRSEYNTLTPYQITPETRALFLAKYGIDGHKDTASAAHVAALHLSKEGDRFINNKFPLVENQDEITHLRFRHYNGGENNIRANWGAINEAYGKGAMECLGYLKKHPQTYDCGRTMINKHKPNYKAPDAPKDNTKDNGIAGENIKTPKNNINETNNLVLEEKKNKTFNKKGVKDFDSDWVKDKDYNVY